MRIGLVGQLRKPLDGTWEDAYARLTWIAKHGDEHGYENIWVAEHHFSAGSTASPSVVMAHIAGMTTRLRVGYSVALLPFHHPIRIAEEMLLIDRMSGGRLDMGVGRGHTPLEVDSLCVAPDKGVEMFNDAVAILQLAFSGKPFKFDGEYWHFPELQLFPPPVQVGGTLSMPITSPRSIAFAAEHNLAPILGNRPIQEIRDTVKAYEEHCHKIGKSDTETAELVRRSAITRVCALEDTFAEAEAVIRRECGQYSFRRGPNAADVLPRDVVEHPPLTDPAADIMYRQGLFGTKDDVIDQLRVLEAAGVHQVSISMESSITAPAVGNRRLERFTREVLPHVHRVKLAA